MKKFEKNFFRYLNAKLPVIYVDTLEDDQAKEIIFKICRNDNRGIIEWSLAGAYDYSDNSELPKADLATTLQLLIADDNLDDKILILRDAHFFFR